MVTTHAKSGELLCIGRKGENNARRVVFDFSHWRMIYGPGTIQLIVQRTGETTPYPAALTVAGNTATWVITAADTAIRGDWGKAELRYMVGDTLAKSETWRTLVMDALGEASETPPEPHQGWVDQVLEAGATAQAAAAQAKADADRAAQIAAEMGKIAAQITQDATAAAQAKADAQTAQGKAETAQKAAEVARQAAEDAANSTGANVTAAVAAANRAESAASQAATALADIQALYQALREYAEQVVQTIQAEGQAQVDKIAAEGTAQLTAMTVQADRAETAAGAAAGSATAAERAQQEAENAKAAAGQSATEAAGSAKTSREAANRAELAAIHQPYPNAETGTWWAWDAEMGAYVDTGEAYKGNVMYATFDIDPATGILSMTIPDGYTGPMFTVNDEGYLEVSISA